MEPKVHTETHTEQAAHGGGHVFPPFDTTTFPSQLLWLAVTFALLYAATSRLILPRLGAILDARRARIASDLQAAQALKAETEAAIATYEKALRDAREKANAIAQEMRNQIQADIDAERAKVEISLNAKIADAEKQIKASRDKVMNEVDGIASEAAKAIVEHFSNPANGADLPGAVKKTA